MKEKYTQRDWDRVVGIGQVPPEYRYEPTEETDQKEAAYERAKEAADAVDDE